MYGSSSDDVMGVVDERHWSEAPMYSVLYCRSSSLKTIKNLGIGMSAVHLAVVPFPGNSISCLL